MGFPEFAWFDFQKESNPVLEVFYATWIKAHLGCGLQTASSRHLGCSRVEMQVKPPERIMSRSDALKCISQGLLAEQIQMSKHFLHTVTHWFSQEVKTKCCIKAQRGSGEGLHLFLRGKKALCFVFRSKYMDYSGSTSVLCVSEVPTAQFPARPDMTPEAWHVSA